MHEFMILFGIKGYAIAIGAGLVGGGALGFLYGAKVQTAAQAEISKASSAIGSAAAGLSKKL